MGCCFPISICVPTIPHALPCLAWPLLRPFFIPSTEAAEKPSTPHALPTPHPPKKIKHPRPPSPPKKTQTLNPPQKQTPNTKHSPPPHPPKKQPNPPGVGRRRPRLAGRDPAGQRPRALHRPGPHLCPLPPLPAAPRQVGERQSVNQPPKLGLIFCFVLFLARVCVWCRRGGWLGWGGSLFALSPSPAALFFVRYHNTQHNTHTPPTNTHKQRVRLEAGCDRHVPGLGPLAGGHGREVSRSVSQSVAQAGRQACVDGWMDVRVCTIMVKKRKPRRSTKHQPPPAPTRHTKPSRSNN